MYSVVKHIHAASPDTSDACVESRASRVASPAARQHAAARTRRPLSTAACAVREWPVSMRCCHHTGQTPAHRRNLDRKLYPFWVLANNEPCVCGDGEAGVSVCEGVVIVGAFAVCISYCYHQTNAIILVSLHWWLLRCAHNACQSNDKIRYRFSLTWLVQTPKRRNSQMWERTKHTLQSTPCDWCSATLHSRTKSPCVSLGNQSHSSTNDCHTCDDNSCCRTSVTRLLRIPDIHWRSPTFNVDVDHILVYYRTTRCAPPTSGWERQSGSFGGEDPVPIVTYEVRTARAASFRFRRSGNFRKHKRKKWKSGFFSFCLPGHKHIQHYNMYLSIHYVCGDLIYQHVSSPKSSNVSQFIHLNIFYIHISTRVMEMCAFRRIFGITYQHVSPQKASKVLQFIHFNIFYINIKTRVIKM